MQCFILYHLDVLCSDVLVSCVFIRGRQLELLLYFDIFYFGGLTLVMMAPGCEMVSAAARARDICPEPKV